MGPGHVHWIGIIGREDGCLWRKSLAEGKDEFSFKSTQLELSMEN
jgi:hypothetical protein